MKEAEVILARSAGFCFGGSLPQPDHGRKIPCLRAASDSAAQRRGRKCPPGEDGGEISVGKSGI